MRQLVFRISLRFVISVNRMTNYFDKRSLFAQDKGLIQGYVFFFLFIVADRCLPNLSKLIDGLDGLVAEVDTGNGKTNASFPVKGQDVNDGSLVVQALTAVNEVGCGF